ncbi:MAG: sensor histidine kinase, partial [Pseudomonadota bacterium]|nr:sensor histidine kinase [Pseudomonadota bacterium]
MTLFPEDGDRGVSPAIALYSILGFWLFYTMLVSLRAAV